MQDTMQDAVCDKHEQMEMLMPPKVLCCKHNHWSVWSADEDKDTKQEERVSVVVEMNNKYSVKCKRET